MYLFDDKRENREPYYIMFSFHTCNITAYKHAISFNYITLFFSFYLKFTKNIFSNCMVIYSVIYTRNICSQSIQVIIIRHLNSPLLNPCKQTGTNIVILYHTLTYVHKRLCYCLHLQLFSWRLWLNYLCKNPFGRQK